ncbi:MAG TPA: hypothetical protein PLT20_02865, partial [Sedimentisphaerales bacterium]|nr:hypothetical protein [Sedimentisphaerales bacterium]
AWTGARKRGWLEAICLVAVSAALILRADVPISRVVQQWRWHRAAPGGTLAGSFRTAQAEYLYGMDGDRWLLREGVAFMRFWAIAPRRGGSQPSLCRRTSRPNAFW